MKAYLSIAEFNTAQVSRIRKLIDNGTLYLRSDYADDTPPDPNFLDSEIVFGNVPAHWYEQKHKVRWAQLESVGFGEYRDLDWDVLSAQLTMTNLTGFFSEPVAQTALAGILALLRGIDELTDLRSQKLWQGEHIRSRLRCLSQCNVLLFGYGSINRRLEELLSPFQCDINIHRRSDTLDDLDNALMEADIVICTVPETHDTVGLFDARRISLLKNNSLFVNCGRGSLVDEQALASALSNNALAGAVIDVTIEEPLPTHHPFWTSPNTILTQHSGGGTVDELNRKISVFARNLANYRQGKSLDNTVDFQRGY